MYYINFKDKNYCKPGDCNSLEDWFLGISAKVRTKEIYKEMQANPYVEVTVSSPAYAWLRIAGKAVFEDNLPVKEGCMAYPLVKGIYQSADNPIFEVFYPDFSTFSQQKRRRAVGTSQLSALYLLQFT